MNGTDIWDPSQQILNNKYDIMYRGIGSYVQFGGGKSVISVCTESSKNQKENMPHINWPTTYIWGGAQTHSAPPPQLFHPGADMPQSPFPMPLSVTSIINSI